MQRLIWIALVAFMAVPAAADPSTSEEEPRPTPFDRGKFGLGFGFGSQRTLGEHYYIVSGAMGYYVLDGVELGLGLAHQFGSGPSITRVTPSLRYVAQPLVGHSPIVPYIGVFGSHYFVYEGREDENTLGARAGGLYIGGSVILGLGIAVERVVSTCAEDCTSVYPDITLAVSF